MAHELTRKTEHPTERNTVKMKNVFITHITDGTHSLMGHRFLFRLSLNKSDEHDNYSTVSN